MENQNETISKAPSKTLHKPKSAKQSLNQKMKEDQVELGDKIKTTLDTLKQVIDHHNKLVQQLSVSNKAVEFILKIKGHAELLNNLKEENIESDDFKQYYPIGGDIFLDATTNDPLFIKLLSTRYVIDRTSLVGVIKVVPSKEEIEDGGKIHMFDEKKIGEKYQDHEIYEKLYNKLREPMLNEEAVK